MLDYDYREILRANLRIYYVGRRVDWRTFTGAAIKGDRYTRVDLAMNYAANEYVEVFSKIQEPSEEKVLQKPSKAFFVI